MAFPSFTTSEDCPIVISKTTLVTGGIFSNQAMKVGYSVPASVVCSGMATTAVFSFDVDDEATSIEAAHVLYLYMACEVDPGEGAIIRMDDNGTYPPDSFISFNQPAGVSAGPASLFYFNASNGAAIKSSGTCSGADKGWLKLDLAGNTRYIYLYDTVA